MAATSLKVALVLTAVSNIAPILQQAQRNLTTFNQSIKQQADDFDQYNKKVKQAEDQIRKYQEMQATGAGHVQSGLLIMAPVEEAVRQAAKFEAAMQKVKTANFDASIPLEKQQKMIEQLSAQATKLGADTVFSNTEAAQAQSMLLRNGMEYIDVLKGGAQASLYLAQTAEIAPAAAADAVSQITNMYQLQGDQLMHVADQVNRAANASSAGVQNIMQDLQASGMSAHTLGLKVKDTVMMLGVLHNMGLGEASGTYFNDMLINLDKSTQKAQKALQSMGWLEGATVKYTTSGTVKIIGGENSLFNEKGEIKSAEELVKKLRSVLFNNPNLKPEELRDSTGQVLPEEKIEELMQAKNKLQALRNLKDVFGVQGMRAAIALATPGKGSYEDMVAKAERAMSIQDQVLEWQGTLMGKLESLKGSWETLMAGGGSPLMKELKNHVQSLIEMTNKVATFANTHPLITKWVMNLIAWFAMAKIAWGSLLWVFGGAGGFITKAGSGFMAFTRYAQGFLQTYKYFRQGAGIFKSLWSAISFGYPAISKAAGMVGRFAGGIGRGVQLVMRFGGRLLWLGAQALLTGARMAVAWMIGLGPVSWILLGISAVVAAVLLAWENNFLGFRDHVTAVWTWIKVHAGAAWSWLKANWKTLILMLIGQIGGLILAWKNNLGAMRDHAIEIWSKIKESGLGIWDAIIDKVKGSIDWFKKAWGWIKGVLHLSNNKPGQNITVGDVPAYAAGGILTRPHLGMIGEAGPEAVIPLGIKYRARALNLYKAIGPYLGVRPYFAGGLVLSGITAPGSYEPPVSKMVRQYQDKRQYHNNDKRQYNIYINNRDPAATAREVKKIIGAPDKYKKSRDPRMLGGGSGDGTL